MANNSTHDSTEIPPEGHNTTVGVVVLGDVGRSPRMQYHCYSLKETGFKVKVLGYNESNFSNSVLRSEDVVNVKQPPSMNSLPRLLSFVLKVVFNTIFLMHALIKNGPFQILLVQNPPAIPTLFVCWFYCKCFRSKLIVDWHNYAYTILSLSVGPTHLLVRISKIMEKFFGGLADSNICVTKAMRTDLLINWNIKATTLYDRPGPTFKPSISQTEKDELFDRLSATYKEFESMKSTDPTALVVSSTSWTEDEDFSILLEALKDYDQNESNNLPPLLCAITGKGPLKTHYIAKIQERSWKKVQIVTPWLEAEDYPRLLASADLGVCLHTSSSGLDLPMKVIDMFGASLPVCAYSYHCLSELVRHDVNGLVFESSKQLASQLKQWFENYPRKNERHEKFRKNILKFQQLDWHKNWVENALRLFLALR